MADETEKPKPAPKPKVYVVEEHSTFEILGSTVTFRANQKLTNEREIRIAMEYNVPLRELAPIR